MRERDERLPLTLKVDTVFGERIIEGVPAVAEDNDGLRIGGTEDVSFEAWNRVLAEACGVKLESIDVIRGRTRKVLKRAILEVVRREKNEMTAAALDLRWEKLNAQRREAYRAAIATSDKLHLLPDYQRWFVRRINAGLTRSSVITNASDASFSPVVRRFPMPYEFDSARFTKTNAGAKPGPDMPILSRVALDVREDEVLLGLGDSGSDARAGLAAAEKTGLDFPFILRESALRQLPEELHHHPLLHFVESLDAIEFLG